MQGIIKSRGFLPHNRQIPTLNGANGKITAPEMGRGTAGCRRIKHWPAARCLRLPDDACPRTHLRVASRKCSVLAAKFPHLLRRGFRPVSDCREYPGRTVVTGKSTCLTRERKVYICRRDYMLASCGKKCNMHVCIMHVCVFSEIFRK